MELVPAFGQPATERLQPKVVEPLGRCRVLVRFLQFPPSPQEPRLCLRWPLALPIIWVAWGNCWPPDVIGSQGWRTVIALRCKRRQRNACGMHARSLTARLPLLKYCSWHRPESYAIWDLNVKVYLRCLQKQTGFRADFELDGDWLRPMRVHLKRDRQVSLVGGRPHQDVRRTDLGDYPVTHHTCMAQLYV